jgi:acyl carrier protein
MRLQEELGLDSVRAFAVMVQLNQELGIPLDSLAEAARDLRSVEDVLNLVATVRARGPVPS